MAFRQAKCIKAARLEPHLSFRQFILELQPCQITALQTRLNAPSPTRFSSRRTMHTLKVCPLNVLRSITRNSHLTFALVNPLHIASVLLKEEEDSGGKQSSPPLFASVIQKAGGEPVSFASLSTSTRVIDVWIQTSFRRLVQKQLVRLPAQQPAPDEVSLGSATSKVLREAQSLQKNMHDSYIAQDHILLALLKDTSIAAIIKEVGLTEATLKTAIQQTRGDRRVDSKNAEQGFDALQKYAIDLTALAEEGKIDPVIGRDNEIRRVVRILCRR